MSPIKTIPGSLHLFGHLGVRQISTKLSKGAANQKSLGTTDVDHNNAVVWSKLKWSIINEYKTIIGLTPAGGVENSNC